jgi:RNA polymerase sigma factor (sigma-70 family)
MARSGNPGAFETIVDRYQGRLLGFCRQMLGSTEDAEDVLQEVFVNAYRAMLADEREINLRPWLYRIARNRCLNQLRKPTADAQESMDMVPAVEAASTAEKVHNREEFRQLLSDVGKLPETQRSALMLREMDAMSYEEIAQAMDTSVPSVKSLLVRARISLAEASQARLLTCGEVRLELAEAAEGLRKVSGPVRRHVRDCEECADFRSQVRATDKALAALFPAGPLLALKGFLASKLGIGGASAGSGAGAAGTGAGASAGAGALGSVGAALGSSGAAGGLGAVGGAIGTKAVAGVVTAAVLTAGAVSVERQVVPASTDSATTSRVSRPASRPSISPAQAAPRSAKATNPQPTGDQLAAAPPAAPPAAASPEPAPTPEATTGGEAAGQSTLVAESGKPESTPSGGPSVNDASPQAGAPPGSETVVVTVGSPDGAPPASSEPAPPPSEPASAPPPSEPAPSPPLAGGSGSLGEGEPATP